MFLTQSTLYSYIDTILMCIYKRNRSRNIQKKRRRNPHPFWYCIDMCCVRVKINNARIHVLNSKMNWRTHCSIQMENVRWSLIKCILKKVFFNECWHFSRYQHMISENDASFKFKSPKLLDLIYILNLLFEIFVSEIFWSFTGNGYSKPFLSCQNLLIFFCFALLHRHKLDFNWMNE